ncbi:hypothetical protein BSU04_10750 [Caballeronia sordidicola]|uniref:Uncharacterized protein n=2 Tax=Caballeronia sordidicola TaxID=196367 RepID=A0A226X6G3_CABSO|nr:hypothetical protein BSU04_10750 [Caballeronia sordidicola]
MDFFGIKAKRQLAAIQEVVAQSARGIHKRIDENRELLETLQRDFPHLLSSYWWIEGWVESQDQFLTDLALATGVVRGLSNQNFPRPWPGRLSERAKRGEK